MNNQSRVINQNDLLTILMNVENPTFVNIISQTKVRMNKTDNPYFEKIKKTSKGNYFIGGSYEDMVNVRMKKEGMLPTFKSEENKVGEHVTKCVQFNEKLNKYYLQYFIFETSNVKSSYEFEGNEIERELFRSYEVKKSQTSRQPQENKHQPQSLSVENIKEISLNGVHYVVE